MDSSWLLHMNGSDTITIVSIVRWQIFRNGNNFSIILSQCFFHMQDCSIPCNIGRLFKNNFSEFSEHSMLTELFDYSHCSYSLTTAPIIDFDTIT